ncbi:hypothetical protein AMS69_13770 [Haloarcula rubripromontorii]|uniref:Uncharacterized protein n=1 Tax=Haloarcula rubripromontorii TaxID=1705562 RepID=A0A0M9AI21_9EURY|nr:hypothetical protein [Haloarcula rubripromontorii]KOX92422.1 hypothetical protein AMS69_13770 [Haloarcula rubripromontorii]
MTENTESKVGVSIECAAAWDFVVPSRATTLSEVTEECIRRYQQLFEAFGDLIIPTEIQTEVEIHDEDRRLVDVGQDRNPRDRNEIVLTGEEISPPDVAAATKSEGNGVSYLTDIRIRWARIKLRLRQGDKLVDRQDCIQYMKGEPRPDGVLPAPMECSVTHYRSKESDPVDTEYKTVISVNLHSDVWMGGSEPARVNRERLGTFLGKLDEAVSPAEIKRECYEWDDFWYNLSVTTDEWGRHTFDPAAIY